MTGTGTRFFAVLGAECHPTKTVRMPEAEAGPFSEL